MSHADSFAQRLARIHSQCAKRQFDQSLEDLESLRQDWPGNAQVEMLWATVVQLQDCPTHSLEDVKAALQRSVELDPNSPASSIELGHYLDAVEDDPKAAAPVFGEAAGSARRLLIEALVGQAGALLQLGKRNQAIECVTQALYLVNIAESKPSRGAAVPDVLMRDSAGWLRLLQLKGPFAVRIDDLLQEISQKRSA